MFVYCPKCKKEIKRDENHYSCESCGFDYFSNPNPAALVILVNHDNKIYLVKRAMNPHAGHWSIPGGFVKFHESAEEAAKREIKEELGLELTNLRFLSTYHNDYLYKNTQYYPLDIVFVSTIDEKEIIPVEKEEIEEGKFFDIEDLPINELAFESHKKAIRDYLKQQNIVN